MQAGDPESGEAWEPGEVGGNFRDKGCAKKGERYVRRLNCHLDQEGSSEQNGVKKGNVGSERKGGRVSWSNMQCN